MPRPPRIRPPDARLVRKYYPARTGSTSPGTGRDCPGPASSISDVTEPTPRRPSDGLLPDQRIRRSWWIFADTFILLTALLVARLLFDGGRVLDWVVVALALIVGIAAYRHRRAVAELEAGRRAEAESFARILSGLSRSVSEDAILGAIVEELGSAAGADHIVVARRGPEPNALEATLISARPGVPPTTTLLAFSGLDEPLTRPIRRQVSLHGRPGPGSAAAAATEAAQAMADRIAEQVRSAYGLAHMLAAPLRSPEGVVGAIVISRRSAEPWSAMTRRLLNGRGARGVRGALAGGLPPRGRGPGLDRCPDRPAQSPLLRRVLLAAGAAAASRGCAGGPDGRHRPVQGPQRPFRPRGR